MSSAASTERDLRRRLLERAKRLEMALTDYDLATNSPALQEAQRAMDAYCTAFNAGSTVTPEKTPEGWEPVDWIATNVCESLDGLLIGHDVFGAVWDEAGLEQRRVLLCELANFIRRELEGSDMVRLRAEVERLTEENAGLLFERGEDELAALCFARESLQRMTGSGHQTVKQLAPLAEALVERLARERDAWEEKARGRLKAGAAIDDELAAMTERVETAERERDEARRVVVEKSLVGWGGVVRNPHAVADALGWGYLYEDEQR